MALSASLHCLAGCMIGEMIGVTIGTHAGFAPHTTVILASVLAFISGYTASIIPLVRAKLSLIKILKVSFRRRHIIYIVNDRRRQHNHADYSAPWMKNLAHPIYWVSRLICMLAAFAVSYPVNLYLLRRGKGHALTHHYHHM